MTDSGSGDVRRGTSPRGSTPRNVSARRSSLERATGELTFSINDDRYWGVFRDVADPYRERPWRWYRDPDPMAFYPRYPVGVPYEHVCHGFIRHASNLDHKQAESPRDGWQVESDRGDF